MITKRKKSIMVLLILLLILAGALPFWSGFTDAIQPSPTPTTLFSWLGLTPVIYPTLDKTTVSGKMAYLDLLGNQIVIVNMSRDEEIHIRYLPGETYEPYPASAIKWSPDGDKLAFECWHGGGTNIDLCILDIPENVTYNQQYELGDFLYVINLPLQYTPDFTKEWPINFIKREHFYYPSFGLDEGSVLDPSFSWTMNGDMIVMTPFCLVEMHAHRADCNGEAIMRNLSASAKELLAQAELIVPSPTEKDVWAIIRNRQIYIIDILSGSIQEIDATQDILFFSWSPDGQKAVVVIHPLKQSQDIIGIIDITNDSFEKLLWTSSRGDQIEPTLLIEIPGTGFYTLYGDVPLQQNISWSPDKRYLVLNVGFLSPWGEVGAFLSQGVFLFDMEKEELIPFRVDYQDLQVFSSPDWAK